MVRNRNSPIGNRIRELRKDAGSTVKELSEKTGLSASALSNYEYGFREPDSKAMAALERFFHVSGEYLHGEIDRDLFLRNQEAADQGLDLLAYTFSSFKEQLLIAAQTTQRAATNAVETMLQSVIFTMMRYDAAPEKIEQYELLVRFFSRLTDDGKAEMLKRLKEYLIVDEQKKQASE